MMLGADDHILINVDFTRSGLVWSSGTRLSAYSQRSLNRLARPAHHADHLLNHLVDRLIHLRLELMDDPLDPVGDAADAEQARHEGDDQRHGAGQRLLDPVRGTADVAVGDLGHRFDDRLHEVQDLVDALDKEHDRAVDHQDGLDDRADRVEHRDQFGHGGLDDLADQPSQDLAGEHLLQVGKRFPNHLPQPRRPAGDELLEQYGGPLDQPNVALADLLGDLGADLIVGQAEHRQHHLEDRGQREVFRHCNAGLGERAEQPGHEALFEVNPDPIDELADALLDRAEQVPKEADRVGDDQRERVPALLEHAHDAIFELTQHLDDLLDELLELLYQALMGVLQILQCGRALLISVLVALRQLLGQVGLLIVHAPPQLRKAPAHLLLRGLSYSLQVRGQSLDVIGDPPLALADLILGLAQARLDQIGDADNQRVHLGQEDGVGLVEPDLDLGRQRPDLILQPERLAADAAVAVVEAGLDIVLHLLDGGLGAGVENTLHLLVEALQLLVYRQLGIGVVLLDRVGDLLTLQLVLLL